MTTGNGFRRRLATVLFADLVGYTRLTEVDEIGTHRALRAVLTLVSELVTRHAGVVAHYAGDAVLAEFTTVIDGLNCAVEIQQKVAERARLDPTSPSVRFRIGLNVGDVIEDAGEIYGDTVNTAVRLQGLAEPGGVCISEGVRNALGRQSPIAYELVGEERLKNLSLPVRAYRALLDTGEPEEVAAELNRKPSVAVMPFENLGGTEDDADSLTEDLIRELSRFRGLEVIAHNTTFVYKGTPTKVQQIAEELEADYVVEGHLRYATNRLRVNVQLVLGSTGHDLWGEAYERPVEQTVGGFDEIVRVAAGAIAGRVHVVSGERARRRPLQQLHAFDLVLRAQTLVGKGKQENALARSHYQRALALEPGNARAFAGISLSHIDDWWNGPDVDDGERIQLALQAAQQAYRADIGDSKVHWVLGLAHCLRRELRQAARFIERAHSLNPNDADAYAVDALIALCQGDQDHVSAALSKALSLNPFPSAWYRWLQGLGYLAQGDAHGARLSLLEALQQNPCLNVARIPLVVAYVELGELDTAREESEELRRRYSGAKADILAERIPADAQRREGFRRALNAAGF